MSMEKEKSKSPKISTESGGPQPISHLSRRSFLSRLGATECCGGHRGSFAESCSNQS